MKIFLLIIIFSTSFTFAQETYKQADMQTGRRTGCYGSGACVFTSSGNDAISKDIYAARFDNKTNQLTIRINPVNLSEKDKIAIFGKSINPEVPLKYTFVMQEDLPLDIATIKSLGGSSFNLAIPVGNYPITEKNGLFFIQIELKGL